MKKIVRLTESDLVRLVRRVISEQTEDEMSNAIPVQIGRYGMDAREAIQILVDNGMLLTTQERTPTQPYTGGILRFYPSVERANNEAIKLGSRISNDIKNSGGQMINGRYYNVDIILGYPSRNMSGSYIQQDNS